MIWGKGRVPNPLFYCSLGSCLPPLGRLSFVNCPTIAEQETQFRNALTHTTKNKIQAFSTPQRCKHFFKQTKSCNFLYFNTLQYPLFCNAKAPVLHAKSAYIATQNRHYCNAKQVTFGFSMYFLYKLNTFFAPSTQILSTYRKGENRHCWRKTYVINRLFCRIVLVFWNSKNHAIDTCAIGFYKLKRCEMRFH